MKSSRLPLAKLGLTTCALSACLLFVVCLPHSAHATVISVTNSSFEESTGYTGSGTPTGVPGWTEGSSYGQAEDVTAKFTSGLTGNQATWVGFTFFNPTAATFVAGETYTMTLDLGQPLTHTDANTPYGFSFGFEKEDNSAFIDDASIFIVAEQGAAIPLGTFQTFSFDYVAQAEDEGKIVKLGINAYFGGTDALYIDNVTASTTALLVPEPSTLLFIAGGFAGLAVVNRRHLGNSLRTR